MREVCPCENSCDCGACCNLTILTIFSLVTSISASSATWWTHCGILNLQGRHSLFHQCNSGEGNRTKLNAVYHSGNDLVLNRELSNDDGDGKEDVKKAIGLLHKTTTLHVHHAFLYISLPSLHDYDVKMPNCKFYGGRKQATTNLFFSL